LSLDGRPGVTGMMSRAAAREGVRPPAAKGGGMHGMKRFDTAAPALFVLSLLALTACEGGRSRGGDPIGIGRGIDPLAVSGRDGGMPLGHEALMRIGAAAHTDGDLETAVGLYRRAAEVNPRSAAPFVAAGNTLLEMSQVNEAIVAYNSALARDGRDPEALRGAARAYLLTGKPELAAEPLAAAFKGTPDDPKILQLIGVANDFAGRHAEAQARYRRGLELSPRDPGLSQNLALSLALTGNYDEAIVILSPIAMAPAGTPRERQTLALIYGLQGDDRTAERIAGLDLDLQSVRRNLAFYETLRRLPPEARARAIRSMTTSRAVVRPS